MLEIKNYSKSYKNGVKAVDNISLIVEEGDLFAFIGHNGAGKSTTIKSIVGILDFEEGDIIIKVDDTRITSLAYFRYVLYSHSVHSNC